MHVLLSSSSKCGHSQMLKLYFLYMCMHLCVCVFCSCFIVELTIQPTSSRSLLFSYLFAFNSASHGSLIFIAVHRQ